jgi:inorganic pyrophosphatase
MNLKNLRKAEFRHMKPDTSHPTPDTLFWQTITDLAATNPITIDRPRASAHPEFPELIYPLNYGYLENTFAGDGEGIDVWFGSSGEKTLTGILCTFDTLERDAEIKVLIGCTHEDIETIRNFNDSMRTLFIPNPMVADALSNRIS